MGKKASKDSTFGIDVRAATQVGTLLNEAGDVGKDMISAWVYCILGKEI